MTDWKQIAENLAGALEQMRGLFSCNECEGYFEGGCEKCQSVKSLATGAMEAFNDAVAPPPAITVRPGRYRFGGGSPDSIAVVLAVTGGKAYGYHEASGIPQGALCWSEDGLFGDGRHENMNLVERLP